MSTKRKVTVNEILNVVGTGMFQVMKHSSGFPFDEEMGKINRKLFDEFPDALTSTDSHQEFVSEELRDAYLELLKKVQQWEKETDQESLIQFVKAD